MSPKVPQPESEHEEMLCELEIRLAREHSRTLDIHQQTQVLHRIPQESLTSNVTECTTLGTSSNGLPLAESTAVGGASTPKINIFYV